MSWLDRFAEKIQDYQQERGRDRHPYLTTKDGKTWFLKQELEGCRPLQVQASVLMEKDPKPLPGPIPPKTPTKPPAAAAAVANPKGQPAAAKIPDNCTPAPPPFDMLDLPPAMERMGFHYAAYCARRWFNGMAHTAPLDRSAIFDKSLVDSESLKLSWVLGFGNVGKRYERLLADDLPANTAENIFSQKARKSLTSIFQEFMRQHQHLFSGKLDAWVACKADIQRLHQIFQFQLASISIGDALGRPTMIMNDLTASLANFGLFAAVANAEISNARYNRYDADPWRSCSHAKVKVTHVYIYAKDSYSFNDDVDSDISQYLGHWNRHGVVVAASSAIAELFSKNAPPQYHHENGNEPRLYLPPVPSHLDKPIDGGHQSREKEIFYPIRNRHFQSWRSLKGRGGDFLIYSDARRIKLNHPIELDLGEVCDP